MATSKKTISGGTTDAPLSVNGRLYGVFDHSVRWQGKGEGHVSSDNGTLFLDDNAWKYVPINLEITKNSVLSFDYMSSLEGEIHAIGFVKGDRLDDRAAFQLAGDQSWGLGGADWSYSAGSGTQSITIPVGKYATGNFDRMVFVMDDDAGRGANGAFSDIRISDAQGAAKPAKPVPGEEVKEPTSGAAAGVAGGASGSGAAKVVDGLEIDGSDYRVRQFRPDKQDKGTAEIVKGGDGVKLTGNAWKYVDLDADLSRDSVLSFDFSSGKLGEIHGVAFAKGGTYGQKQAFTLAGTDDWGRTSGAWDYEIGSGTQNIEIAVGKYVQGKYDRLVLIADDDAKGKGESVFSNISLDRGTTEPNDDGGKPAAGNDKPAGGADNGLRINDKSYKVGTYSAGDQNGGNASVSGDGKFVSLSDNAWKAVSLPTKVTADTVLSFDFSAGKEGEIHGIGFAKGPRYSDKHVFQMLGDQKWGIHNKAWDYDIGDGTESYQIRVGDYFRGSFDKLLFVMDDDAGTGGTSRFGNIEIRDVKNGGASSGGSTPKPSPKEPNDDQGVAGGGDGYAAPGGGSGAPITGGGNAQLIISTGQSLTVGATDWSRKKVITSSPVDADKAFSLDYKASAIIDGRGWQKIPINTNTFEGFQPLKEHVTETHASGMISAILADYQAAGKSAPDMIHFNAGVSGARVSALSTGTPMDNMRKQLDLVAREAKSEGLKVDNDILVYFNQGAADSSTPYGTYKQQLETYFDRIDSAADRAFGRDMDVKVLVSPGNGYNQRNAPIAQLDLAIEDGDVFAGRTSHLSYEYSSSPNTPTGHLSPWGYNVMGQHAGHYFYDIMQGRPDAPMLISNVKQTGDRSIKVTMSGVDGRLVYDDDWMDHFQRIRDVPDHFNFRLFSDRGYEGRNTPQPVSSKISGNNTVDLTFDRDIDGDWRLYLGRPNGEDVVGGTSLRESATDKIIVPGHMRGAREVVTNQLDEYAPVQYVDVDFF